MRSYFRKSVDNTKNVKSIGEEGEAYIEKLVSEMTLDEKMGMIHGVDFFENGSVERLGIPSLISSDGPHGVRPDFNEDWSGKNENYDFITYMPCNSALASTWNRQLAYDQGKVLGCEFRGRGKDVALGPGINIKRDPLCGRNFEYMSEDPRLVEEMAVPLIRGMQINDVAACVKHFAVNCQETERLSVDTEVSDRALNEIYFPGFLAAVTRGGSYTLMGAYNKLRGTHCCHNKELLDDILRDKWGFDGAVISDWGGVHDTMEAAMTSLDLEMGVFRNFDEYYMADPLKNKILSGDVTLDRIDAKVKNILRTLYRLKKIGPDTASRKAGTYNAEEHRHVAKQVADESVVLLKNKSNVLPLDKSKVKKLLVVGYNAQCLHALGGGSSELRSLYEICPLMGIKMLLGGNTEVVYEKGYEPPVLLNELRSWQANSTDIEAVRSGGEKKELDREKSLILKKRALEAARDADAVIYIGGQDHIFDAEGYDRSDMKLPYDQDVLIDELLDMRPDTVVVLMSGSPVSMPWVQKADSLLFMYYAGIEGGNALADVIFGKVNPSGRLVETFLKTADDAPAHMNGTFGAKEKVNCEEDIYVGYRYYDTHGTQVNFPFGHGLSYTEFEYDNLAIAKVSGGGGSIEVHFTVENIGKRSGHEVVQLYVRPVNPGIDRPIRELKAFEKLMINPGEMVDVTLSLSAIDFSYYSEEAGRFVVDHGEYIIEVGASVSDIRMDGRVKI